MVSRLIYVFTGPDTGISTVSFYVDDPGATRSPYRIEKSAPFDLAGGDVALARAFDTRSLRDGQHTVSARLQKADGTVEMLTVTFVVDN